MSETKKNDNGPRFVQAKSEYNQIYASDALQKKVKAALAGHKQSKGKRGNRWVARRFKYVGGAVAVLVLSLAVMVNASPAFADTVANIPGMSGIVKVMTFGHYEYKSDTVDATVDTPAITGLSNKDLENKLNKEFAVYSSALIGAFEKEVKEWQQEYPSDSAHFGMDSGYQVLTNTEDYLSIDIYLVNTAASSSTVEKFYTINKKTQKLLTLSGLFTKNADYEGVLEKYVTREMKSQMKSGEHTYWVDEPDMMPEKLITPGTLFYINENNQLVLSFEKYSIAPGCEGSPEFIIPKNIIVNILDKSGGNDLR
jgi:hypothetical protein